MKLSVRFVLNKWAEKAKKNIDPWSTVVECNISLTEGTYGEAQSSQYIPLQHVQGGNYECEDMLFHALHK